MRHAGQVVTRTMLLENVWDYHFDPQTNVIDVHISRLRSKIDKGFTPPLAAYRPRRRIHDPRRRVAEPGRVFRYCRRAGVKIKLCRTPSPGETPETAIMSRNAAPFIAARDFLLRHREDYATAYRDFRWPKLDRFNWALDYFDVMARDNAQAGAVAGRRRCGRDQAYRLRS